MTRFVGLPLASDSRNLTAAIDGISFIIDLIRERLLDVKLYRVRGGDQDGDARGVEAIHEVYGKWAN